MTWLLEPFSYEFMRRALVACALVGLTNGFIGSFVVLRRLSLVADALAHSLLPGLAISSLVVGLNVAGLLLGGILASVFVALGGHLIARSSRVKDETAVASLYIIAFAVGIAVIKYAHVRVSLDHFLFGNLLGIGDSDLWFSYGTSALVLLTLAALHRPLLLAIFEPSVAASQGVRVGLILGTLIVLVVLTMITSLQAVGVLLSLGLMILPAATIYLLSDSYALMSWGSGLLGAGGAVIGLLLSYWANVPSGPAIVLVLGAAFLAAYLFSPKYGVVANRRRRRHLHEESLDRWK